MTKNWQRCLRLKTRQPGFLWRMVLGILAAGVILGVGAELLLLDASAQPEIPQSLESEEFDELERLAQQDEWGKLWWAIPAFQLSQLNQAGPVALACLTGLCWMVFLCQVLADRARWAARSLLAIAGVVLGGLSIWVTLFFILWQEHQWGLVENDQLIAGLRFFVLGVGLREEAAKLICLLPLMPILLRWFDELTTLVVAASVGIGFALLENAGYFVRSGGFDSLGRFLTANPLHMTFTGLAGLAVYRGLRDPRNFAAPALATFGLVVFAHGLYDAMIILPDLAEYSLFAIILFALVVFQFFRELRDLRRTHSDVVSLTATFLAGVSLITAATFVYLSATVGVRSATDFLAQEALGLAVMAYLFLREMPETMIDV